MIGQFGTYDWSIWLLSITFFQITCTECGYVSERQVRCDVLFYVQILHATNRLKL